MLFGATLSANAHHSLDGTYDLKTEVRLEGKIVQALIRNPHSFLQIEVPDENGSTQRWSLEWVSANSLAKRGIKGDTLKGGDEVTVTMNPSRQTTDKRGVLKSFHRGSDGLEWSTKAKIASRNSK